MKARLQTLTVFVILVALVSGITACNTVRGVGEDTERAGEKIQQKVDEHKRNDHD